MWLTPTRWPAWPGGAARLVAVGLAAGCPSGDDSADPLACDSLPPAVSVGNGDTAHVPLQDGDPVTMVHGPQGGWHVWVSLAVTNLGPDLRIHITLEDLTRGDAMADLNYAMVAPAPDACVSTLVGLFGFLPYDDPGTPEDETPPDWRACDTFRICAEVSDDDGRSAHACVDAVAIPDPADATVSC